jgi:hypothetical protein
MPRLFKEQLDLLDGVLEGFYAGTSRVTLCLSSGISLGCMPSVANLISSAITALPQNPQAEELFEQYENHYHISDELRAAGPEIQSEDRFEFDSNVFSLSAAGSAA